MVRENSDKRCKASNSEFVDIWPGLKQCMFCGFTLATYDSDERSEELGKEHKPLYSKEDNLHSTYHGKFYKCKSEYGYSCVLTYKDMLRKIENLPSQLCSIKDNDVTSDLSSLSFFISDILNIISELESWVSVMSVSDSPIILDIYKSICLDLSSLRSICSPYISQSFDIPLFNSLVSLVSPYRQLFEKVLNLEMSINSSIISDLALLSFPPLSFKVSEKLTYLDETLQLIPSKLSRVDSILSEFSSIEFTKSLRMWDMCKPHPRFEDYRLLLWNSPKFLSFIKPYMTSSQYSYYLNKSVSNRQLVDYKFPESPFYFGKVMESDTCYSCRSSSESCSSCLSKETLTSCYSCIYCKSLCCNVIDLSYMDTLSYVSEDDDFCCVSEDDDVDYAASAKALELLGSLCFKG